MVERMCLENREISVREERAVINASPSLSSQRRYKKERETNEKGDINGRTNEKPEHCQRRNKSEQQHAATRSCREVQTR
jgi:hypothetical protein